MPPLSLAPSRPIVAKNLKTALVLVSVVVIFFAGVVIRHWLWPGT